MSGRWDEEEHEMDRECDAHGGGHNHGDNFGRGSDDTPDDNNNGRWAPRHHDSQPPDRDKDKVYSVSEAARRHEGTDISVRGIISGVQPLRKMIKGISVRCTKCSTVYERKYDKPELFESFVPIERIRKCVNEGCKTGDYLVQPKLEIINAVVVELKDENTFSEIDPLRIILFGDDEPAFDNTLNIDRHVGEPIQVKGDIFNINIGKGRESKVVAYLYVKYMVKYLSRHELELILEDAKEIKEFVEKVGPDNVVEKLKEMFATSVIGNDYVKKGLLLVAVSTSLDKKSKKLHSILVEDPGLAKSELLKHAVSLVPNSRYENVQFATGKSLTAIVSKEEGDTHILRIGPIPQAKGAIAALNEIGRMSSDDQAYMLDTMQEQEFTTNKFGLNFHVDAPTAIIASANPVGGSWKAFGDQDDTVDLDQIPMIKPLVDRFDMVFVFKDTKDEGYLADYADKKSQMEDNPSADNTEYLIKHIMYAKQLPKPIFSEEAKIMLNQCYVKIRSQSFGSPRVRETIYRIAQNITRLKLKREVDAADAKETMTFYNIILQQLGKIVSLPSNPKDVAYNECLQILIDSVYPIAYEEVVKTACAKNQHVSKYIGNSFKLEHNKKLRPILEMLRNHSRIKEVQMRPVVLQYIHSDHSDLTGDTPTQKISGKNSLNHEGHEGGNSQNTPKTAQKNIVEVSGLRSERSDRSVGSDSMQITTEDWSECIPPPNQQQIEDFFHDDPDVPWEPLLEHELEQSPCYYIIEKDNFKASGQTYYYCKIHPEVWNINLVGIEHHCKYKDPDLHKSEALRLALKAHTVVCREDIA